VVVEARKPSSDKLVRVLLGLAAVLFVVIVGIVAFVAGRESGDGGAEAAPVQTNSNAPEDFDYNVLNEIRSLLDRFYVRPENLDDQSLFEAAVNGMLDILNDSGTYYVTPEDYQISTTLTGSFDGIGATVSEQNGEIVIVAPIENTPAERAGLVSGDIILAVDGESISGWTVDQAVLRIRGEKGTEVVLTVRRADGTEEDIAITRDTVQVDSVVSDPPGGILRDPEGNELTNIGYVWIREFSRRTAEELEAAIQQQLNAGAEALIIDVRNNGGGLLDTTISSADLFLDNGTILIERDAAGREANHVAKAGQIDADMPIVMLQNRFSASASEVMLAALMENGRAVSVGETSFGKGTVNSPRQLQDGGALFVTIAEWLTPNGTLINNVGVRPDFEVIPTDEQIDAREDPQLARAIEVLQEQLAQ
jgi:carboxyl-terminal processing protease